MKKFIATAALVAASTALASAATVVFTTASSVSGATESVALTHKGTVQKAQTLTFTSSTTFSGATSALSLGYYISSGNDWVANTPSSTNSNTALNTAFTEATGLSLSDFLGSNFYGSGAGGTTATLTFSGLKANTEYRFSFVGTGISSAATLSITTGTLSDTTRGGGSFYGALAGTGTTEITSSSATATLAAAGSTSSAATSAATFVVTSDSNGNVVFGTNASKPGFLAVAVSDVIPEPSAFGLLAGIGALALAVSRRKRSRR